MCPLCEYTLLRNNAPTAMVFIAAVFLFSYKTRVYVDKYAALGGGGQVKR